MRSHEHRGLPRRQVSKSIKYVFLWSMLSRQKSSARRMEVCGGLEGSCRFGGCCEAMKDFAKDNDVSWCKQTNRLVCQLGEFHFDDIFYPAHSAHTAQVC